LIYFLFGWQNHSVLPWLAALIGILLLENVNYIELTMDCREDKLLMVNMKDQCRNIAGTATRNWPDHCYSNFAP
jgi:hypothetical protein